MKECHLEIEYTTLKGKRLKPVLVHSYISNQEEYIEILYAPQDPRMLFI